MSWDFTFIATLARQPLTSARLFSSARGEAPTLLFIHGGFHGAWCWSPFLNACAARHLPAAAIDLRGHGGLPQDENFIHAGVADMAADVAEAAACLGGPVVLVGHSLGALVAMAAAKDVRPAGMILLAPMPPANLADVKLLPPFGDNALVMPPPPERARKWFLSGYGGDDNTPYLERLSPESPAFLNDAYRRRIMVDPAWAACPMLCLSGGKDESPLHHRAQDEAVAAFYGADLVTAAAAGHCMMLDDSTDETFALLAAWLEQRNLAGDSP